MAEGKWIPGLTAEQPVAVAARRALAVRLEVVQASLPPAAELAARDVEHVHQLRVATRRCRAALDLFSEALPERLYERLRRLLRRIRRAAGPARDADVLFAALSRPMNRATPRAAPGYDWVSGQLAQQRQRAQEALAAAYPDLASRLARGIAEAADVAAEADASPATRLIDLARARLPLLVARVEQAVPDEPDQEALHRLRIEGKRLRYAMEIFGACFAAEFREVLYPRVEALQEHLGEVNDAHVAIGVLASMQEHAAAFYPQRWPRWQPGVHALLVGQRRRLGREKQRFRRFWQQWEKDKVGKLINAAMKSPVSDGLGAK